jgi:RNA polymerase sigma-70 factor (ECF subfamily)
MEAPAGRLCYRWGGGASIGFPVRNRNDHVRFAEVFLPHLADAYRLARWLSGSRADAEDIVQEASIRAFQAIGQFAGINGRAWTLTIVRNTTYTWLAKNRPESSVFTADLDPDELERVEHRAVLEEEADNSPEAELIARVEAEEARKLVVALPPPFREVLILREIQELTYHEIAVVTGTPIGTVMSRLSRARRLLIEAIGRDGK